MIDDIHRMISLRSKHFQSSYCAKVPFIFALAPTFLDELARKRLLRRLQDDVQWHFLQYSHFDKSIALFLI